MSVVRKCLIAVFGFITGTAFAIGQEASWQHKLERPEIKLKLSPLSSDEVKAFFIGRGFSSKNVDFLAKSACLFRSDIGSNAKPGGPKLEVAVDQWKIVANQSQSKVRLRNEWAKYWQKINIDEEQQTAFHWAMFPTRQIFNPSDYNWGMLSFMLPAGTRFDLDIVWFVNNAKQSATIKELQCGK